MSTNGKFQIILETLNMCDFFRVDYYFKTGASEENSQVEIWAYIVVLRERKSDASRKIATAIVIIWHQNVNFTVKIEFARLCSQILQCKLTHNRRNQFSYIIAGSENET